MSELARKQPVSKERSRLAVFRGQIAQVIPRALLSWPAPLNALDAEILAIRVSADLKTGPAYSTLPSQCAGQDSPVPTHQYTLEYFRIVNKVCCKFEFED